MIKNERQYRMTKKEARKFEETIQTFERDHTPQKGVHPRLLRAQKDALHSQLASLKAEIEEYEHLRRRRSAKVDLGGVEELPKMLVRARIKAGLTQRDLAERLGLKEQQIQRYEATDYASASLARVIEIVRVLSAG